jgi:hypothetical protein
MVQTFSSNYITYKLVKLTGKTNCSVFQKQYFGRNEKNFNVLALFHFFYPALFVAQICGFALQFTKHQRF